MDQIPAGSFTYIEITGQGQREKQHKRKKPFKQTALPSKTRDIACTWKNMQSTASHTIQYGAFVQTRHQPIFISDSAPVNLALIAADESTYPAVEEACRRYGLVPHLLVAPYDDMHMAVATLPPDIDIILCRAGTAEYVSDAVSLPVVSIPITPFDLIWAIGGRDVRGKKLAFLSYRSGIPCADKVAEIFDCSITQYAFTDKESIREGVLRAQGEGADICVGGSLSMLACREIGMEGIKIFPNEDTVFRAVAEARHLVTVSRQEREKAARLKVVFDTISEGIVVTDNQNDIIICNPAAARIFNVNEAEVLGKNARTVVPATRMHTVFETGEPEINHLQKIRDDVIAINTLPILADGAPIGVVSTVNDVTKIQQLEQIIRKELHSKGFVARYTFDDIQTANEAMLECKKLGQLYATTAGSVIIEGESGTGKELFAQSIHNASRRSSGPFVAVNCAAIPDTLLESELFGYEGGSFTGAKKDGKQGLFELAHKGTIFLDEISELPLPLQARLLRVLQEKEVRRVGGDKIIPVDTRIISATNKDISQKIREGTFRDDLFYRLNVFHLKIPPLRERKGDIPLLAAATLRKLGAAPSREFVRFVSAKLAAHDWPGNVRELHNIMERIALLAGHGTAETSYNRVLDMALGASGGPEDVLHLTIDADKTLKLTMAEVEKNIVSHVLARNGQDMDKAARALGIGRTSVWRKSRCRDNSK